MTIALARIFRAGGRRPSSTRSLNDSAQILVVRPDGIGDVIMMGPMLRELRRVAPRAAVTLIVAHRARNFVEICPYVDRVVTVDIPPPSSAVETWWRPLARRMAAFSVAHRYLRGHSYDIALVPRWGVDRHEASVLAYLSGASQRVGYSEDVSPSRAIENRGYDRFFTTSVHDVSVMHEVERNLGILTALDADPSPGGLEAWLSDMDAAFAEESLGSDCDDWPVVVLGPGAGSPRRMWPIERFVEVAHWVSERNGKIVVVGGLGDEHLAAEVASSVDGALLDLTNKATLRETVAVLRRCSVFCGNDAGSMHLAAASGLPVVEISCHPRGGDELHPNSPVRFGPWGVRQRVLRPARPRSGCMRGCRASTPHCILDVSASSVIDGLGSLLADVSPHG